MGVVMAVGAGRSFAAPAAHSALDKPAFTATPAELLALGKAAAGDAGITILREERDVRYDDKGRATVRVRRISVVATPDDLDDDGQALTAPWQPSYQDRPVIRARVIDPGGKVAELDPAAVTELPAASRSAGSTDRKFLSAALPAVVAGSVVEQEIVTVDREPPIAGAVDIATLPGYAPVASTVISYSAPVSARLHHVERQLPAAVRVRHQIASGRESWIYEVPALPARTDFEVDVPLDVVMSSYVGVATAPSWEAVARAYRAAVDRQIAEGPVDLPAELPHSASPEAVDAVLAWLHRHVRSAGGFGAVHVPLPPAETVRRGAGDSFDQAALLVALLRQAQIRAEVALIQIGWPSSIDPDLPGASGFDHALVRVRLGGRDMWIDPVEALARPGQLSEFAQGRRVLVIADDTKALAVTPAATAADNTIREVRTFVAAEHGGSQLTQAVHYSGVLEVEQRGWVHAVRGDQLERQYARRAETLFVGTLDHVTSSDPEDLATPFAVTVAVNSAFRVETLHEAIEVYLFPNDALVDLPWAVTQAGPVPRQHDFRWSRPEVHEIENRIVVPPGFTLPAPAPERVRSIGTATFTERQRIDGQSLIVTFLLDTGKPRLTPSEVTALQAALKELGGETVHLRIEHTASALSHAGKPRDAIAECDRLIALHPKEALHHSQLASALLHAGAGAAARREARKAVAMARGDVEALVRLGWVLSYDTLGRPYTYDWDRAGAVAALEQARKLDPKHLGAAVTLAEVLERDAAGRPFQGDLAGAVAARRAAVEIASSDEQLLELARVLAWSGQFAEVEKVARGAASGDERDQLLVAAVAATGGAKAALRVAGELRSGDARTTLLDGAGRTLVWFQRYDLARELFTETGMFTRLPASAVAQLKQLKPYPEIRSGTADPRAAALDVLAALLDPARRTPVFWNVDLERQLRGQLWRYVPPLVRSAMSARWVTDMLQSVTGVEVEGEAGVWRATIDEAGQRFQLYLVLDRGVAKVLGTSDVLSEVGRHLLRTSDAAAEARARKLLDWIRTDTGASNAREVIWFKRLWGPGMPVTRDAILLAAAVLAGGRDPDRVLPIAIRCPSTLPDAETTCRELRFAAYYARRRWGEAVAEAEALVAQQPDSLAIRVRGQARALARAGRFDDADRLVDQVLAKDPDDYAARVAKFEIAALRGIPAEITQRADTLVNHPAAGAQDLNYVAWYGLAPNGDLTRALELARRSVDKSAGYANVNTLAAIEAELGDLDRAVHDNWRAMRMRGWIEPTRDDWYVVGRVDEQLGLAGDAIEAYRHVNPVPDDALVDTYALAQRRLAALRAGH